MAALALSGPTAADYPRDAEYARRYAGGETMEEIAVTAGISRERVRQRIARHEEKTGEAIRRHGGGLDPVDLLRAARAPGVMTLVEVAASLGVHANTVGVAMRKLNRSRALNRLYRLRRRAKLARQLAALATKLGRTPTAADMIDAHSRGESVYPATLQIAFGSLVAAQIAAGLQPNSQGSRMHINAGVEAPSRTTTYRSPRKVAASNGIPAAVRRAASLRAMLEQLAADVIEIKRIAATIGNEDTPHRNNESPARPAGLPETAREREVSRRVET